MHSRDESGGTLVETALSIFLLLTFMFGIIEGSLGIYSYHFIANAAREGTRYAIVRGSTWIPACTSTVYSGCTASAAQIESHVSNLSLPGIDSTKLVVTPQCAAAVGGTFGTFGTFPGTCNAAGDMVQVTVSYPYSIPIVGIKGSCSAPKKFCMTTTSEMVISQ
jgi:Flp pilus assembly protein TadG